MITLVTLYAVSISLLVIVIMRAPLRDDLPDTKWEGELADRLTRHRTFGHHDQASAAPRLLKPPVLGAKPVRDKHVH